MKFPLQFNKKNLRGKKSKNTERGNRKCKEKVLQ